MVEKNQSEKIFQEEKIIRSLSPRSKVGTIEEDQAEGLQIEKDHQVREYQSENRQDLDQGKYFYDF